MVELIIPPNVLEISTINTGVCTHPAGHCYGSDGGSGIANDLKVKPGQGGEQEVWTLDNSGTKLLKKELYDRCQFCLRYAYIKDI